MNVKIAWHDENAWNKIKENARFTVHKYGECKSASPEWKKRILLAEHSPIRSGRIIIELYDVPSYVIGHLVRHKWEPFVSTLRSDRTNLDYVPDRNTPNSVRFDGNYQDFINISRKRLCSCADEKTRKVWQMVKDAINEVEPELASCMVRECVYRGFCPEMNGCGFSATEQFKEEVNAYRVK